MYNNSEALQLVTDNNNNSNNGCIYVAKKNKKGEFSHIFYIKRDQVVEKIEKLILHENTDYYIMSNTVKVGSGRQLNNLFSLNNIVIDIDNHSERNSNSPADTADELIFRLKRDMPDIPCPNIVHMTGRGIQLWWHIEQCASALLFLYNIVKNKLITAIDKLISEYPETFAGYSVDITASRNAVGVYRLFDTYNTSTGTKSQTNILTKVTYDLNDLLGTLECSDVFNEDDRKAVQRKTIMHVSRNYISLNAKRISMIQYLAGTRKESIGNRDIMCFLMYNSAIQIYSHKYAVQLTEKLNRSFSSPLKDLKYIYDHIQKHGYYRFKNDTFSEWLSITADEINEFETGHITQNAAREAKRRERAADKAHRKSMAEKLILEGKMKLQEIADKVGYSLRTIKTISSEIKKKIRGKMNKDTCHSRTQSIISRVRAVFLFLALIKDNTNRKCEIIKRKQNVAGISRIIRNRNVSKGKPKVLLI